MSLLPVSAQVPVPAQAQWELPAGLQAAAAARRIVRAWLAEACPDLAAIADELELTASELAANAAEHGTPPVVLALSAEQRDGTTVVTATVHDAGPWLPMPSPREPLDDERHRGLLLIAAMSSQWGVRDAEGGGKDVWCAFSIPGHVLPEVA